MAVFMYGCETWTLTPELQRRIRALEMKRLRKILNIFYTNRISNEAVRERITNIIGPHEDLLSTIRGKKTEMQLASVGCQANQLLLRGERSLSYKATKKMGKYQLIYFNVRGKGEAIRLLLKDNGIAFEEITCGENWQKEWKPQMQFGQVPAFKDSDLQLVQTNAILRHLARKHGLYGNNEEEASLIDMINDGVEDLRLKYLHLIYKNYENGKADYIADLPNQLQYFEKLLSSNGADKSGCCVGNKRSFADYNLFDLLDINQVLSPKCLEDFPTLNQYYQFYLGRPGIADHRESESFKQRPINGNGKQ